MKLNIKEQQNKIKIIDKISNNRYELSSVPPNFQDDIDVVRMAISLDTLCSYNGNGPVFQYASPRLKSNRQMVLEAVKNYGEVIEFINPNFDDDKEIIITALKNMWVDTYPYGGSVIYNCIPLHVYKDKRVREAMGYIKEETNAAKFLVDLSMDLFPDKDERVDRKKREEEYNKNYLKNKKDRLERWNNEVNEWENKIIKFKQDEENSRLEKYFIFRKQIEIMPMYERWRQDVIKKCGDRCQIDRSHLDRKIEVHHIDSLYSIYIAENLTSNEKIIKCNKLWNVDNGIVLCKECHDNMDSSKNRQILIIK